MLTERDTEFTSAPKNVIAIQMILLVMQESLNQVFNLM